MANALGLVGLDPLMRLSPGRPEVVIGLIDGPIAVNHADLVRKRDPRGARKSERRLLEGQQPRVPPRDLHSRKFSSPDAVRLHRPSAPTAHCWPTRSSSTLPDKKEMPSAKPDDLAVAILACIAVGGKNSQSEPRPHAILRQGGAGAGRRSGLRQRKGCNRRRGGGQPGLGRRHHHHASPLGRSGRERATRMETDARSRTSDIPWVCGASVRPARRSPVSARTASRSHLGAPASLRPLSPARSPFSGRNSRQPAQPRSRPP